MHRAPTTPKNDGSALPAGRGWCRFSESTAVRRCKGTVPPSRASLVSPLPCLHSGTEEIPPPSDRARMFIHSQSRQPLQPIRMTQQSFDMRGGWLAGVHCKKRSAPEGRLLALLLGVI